VGRVGYAPTTPAMSMQYSTIELTARVKTYYADFKRSTPKQYSLNLVLSKLKLSLSSKISFSFLYLISATTKSISSKNI
tara:strand:- start:275 stop:511 length:237 start_codon:yes stop_codon:yes gene_type:complete